MRYACVLMFLAITNFSFCQEGNNPIRKIAIINNSIGERSFVRMGKSDDSQVIDTIYVIEFFHVIQDSTSNWWKVFYAGKVGYLNKSEVEIVESMDYLLVKKMINDIFITQKELLLQMQIMICHGEHNSYLLKFLNYYNDNRYRLILSLASKFIIEYQDKELLSNLIDVIALGIGSADEIQAYTLGKVAYYLPEETFALVTSKNSQKLNQYLINSLSMIRSVETIDDITLEILLQRLKNK